MMISSDRLLKYLRGRADAINAHVMSGIDDILVYNAEIGGYREVRRMESAVLDMLKASEEDDVE